jgi:altronate dehydratase small subunit
MPIDALRITPLDNVATALRDLPEGHPVVIGGAEVSWQVVAAESIPAGHKLALCLIPAGETIIKYGEPIGKATVAILPGSHTHIHNVEGRRGRGDLV